MIKKVQKLIIYILTFAIILPRMNLISVLALEKSLEHSFTQTLSVGDMNQIPILNKPGVMQRQEETLFNWDLSDNTSSNPITMTYKIKPGLDVKLTTTKLGNIADVKLDFVYANPALKPSEYYIYYHNVNGVPKFVDTTTYMNEYNVLSNYKVNNAVMPEFTMEKDTGFSFIYDGIKMHVLWQDDKFYFMPDSLKAGTCYDFSLSYEGVTKVKTISNGVSKNTLSLMPYANDNNTVNYNNSVNQSDLNLFSINQGEILLNEDGAPDVAGIPQNGIVIGFDIPTDINGNLIASNRFGSYITLNSIDSTENVLITINDIVNARTITTTKGTVEVIDSATSPNRIVLKISDLPTSTIYYESSIAIFDNASPKLYDFKDTVIDSSKVFTYTKIDLVYENSQYFIQIEPYKGHSGEYMLLKGMTKGNLKQAEQKYYTENTGVIKFPLVESELASNYYQVLFMPNGKFETPINYAKITYSQIMKFLPSLTGNKLGIANNFDVIDYKLIKDQTDASNVSGILELKTRWDIGKKSSIDQMLEAKMPGANVQTMKLTYRMNSSLVPEFNAINSYTDIVLTITRDKKDILNINDDVYTISYQGDDVVEKLDQPLQIMFNSEVADNVAVSFVDFVFDVSYLNITSTEKFKFPNIYFLNVHLIEVDGVPNIASYSNYDSITLDDLTKGIVPVPQNIKITDNTLVGDNPSFKVSYDIPSSKIQEFIYNYYQNPDSADFNINVNLYISQTEQNLKDVSNTPYEQKDGLTKIINYDKALYNAILSFSNTGDNTVMAINGFADPRQALRDGNVVKIKGIDLDSDSVKDIILNATDLSHILTLDGLDKNQKYYIVADLEIIYNKVDPVKIDGSKTTNIVSELTKSDKEQIDENEKTPEVPTLQKENVGLDKATVFWDKIDPQKGLNVLDDISIEYEMIRLTAEQLTDEQIFSRIPFEKFFSEGLTANSKVGLKIQKDKLSVFNNSSFADANSSEFELQDLLEQVKVTDKTLDSNQLYFYYVRSVRVVNGQKAYSTWANISVTTTPVKAPINLAIAPDKMNHNPKTEFVIEFDAPLADITKLGTDYFIEYALKEDDGTFLNPVKMNIDALKNNYTKSEVDGYFHFVYKLSNLKPATTYAIKVRMLDKKQDASLYTNIAVTRTEVDQELYDEENLITDWNDYAKEQLNLLLNRPYWELKNNENFYEVIFREDMFAGFIGGQKDSIFDLPSGTSSDKTYYIPASGIKALNDKGLGLRVTHENMEVLIGKSAVLEEDNDAIKQVLQRIKDKNLDDYYIKLRVVFEDYSSKIENKDVLGKIAKVYLDVIGTDKKAKVFDENSNKYIKEQVNLKASDNTIKNKLRNYVKAEESNEFLVKEVKNIVDSLGKSLENNFTRDFEKMSKRTYPLSPLSSSIIIVNNNIEEGASVYGYKSINGVWQTIDVQSFNEKGKAIYTREQGIFAFAGNNIVFYGVDNFDGNVDFRVLLTKYNLVDFLGKDNITLSLKADKNMVLGSTARMMGAKKGEDIFAFLKSKGIPVTNRNLYKEINIQEAIYTLMNVYESKTNGKINSYQIKNFNLTNNIKDLDPKYKKSMHVALETGVLKLNVTDANQKISIKELIEILVALDY